MAALLVSCCSGIRFHSCRGDEANSAVCSSVILERANCFTSRFPKAVVCSGSRVGDTRVLVRAERQTDGKGPGDVLDNVDIQVFRFTLGIPGFDDSDLPRVVGILFGGLLVLNHAFSLNSVTPALLRSEAVGLFLAVVSMSLPAINRQLNQGENSSSRQKAGEKQVFGLADNLSDTQRQELAWSSYTLLRNTNSTACLVSYGGRVVCARGFWDIPTADGLDSKSFSLVWLEEKLKITRWTQLLEPLYIPSNADGQESEVVPRGTASLLLQPFPQLSLSEGGVNGGFLLVISNIPQAYRRKDRVWITAVTKKLSEVLYR